MKRLFIIIIALFLLVSCEKKKDPSQEEVASFTGGSITVSELQKRFNQYLVDFDEQTIDEGKDVKKKRRKAPKKKVKRKPEEILKSNPKLKQNIASIKYRLVVQMVLDEIVKKEKIKGSLTAKAVKKLFNKYNVSIHVKRDNAINR